MRQMAVWMDGNEARVFDVGASRFGESWFYSPNHHVHRHPKDEETRTHNHPDDEHRFFRDVADALAGADQVLLVGPSVTKLRFFRYVQKRVPDLEPRIVGLETADHPTARQLVAHVREYFQRALPRHGLHS
jgi:stalled ribosome rescue protein Dom34